jgi:hypothetical protein
MTWDIFIQDLPAVPSVADIPVGHRPATLGPADGLLARVQQVVPFAEKQDDDWLFVRAHELDLSLHFSKEAGTSELSHVAVHVHGGERSGACVAAIVRALGLRALDTATGEFFDPEAAGRSAMDWSRHLDGILRRSASH